jgi:copper(I)-binding protein
MSRAAWLIGALLASFAHSAGAAVLVDTVWARATAPGSSVGVVYARIVAEQADELLSIDSSAAERAEIHVSSSENGTMKMRPMTSVKLPARKPVQLRPGGIHVMLIGLHKPLQAGTSFELRLRFRSAATLTVMAKVIGPGDTEPAQ